MRENYDKNRFSWRIFRYLFPVLLSLLIVFPLNSQTAGDQKTSDRSQVSWDDKIFSITPTFHFFGWQPQVDDTVLLEPGVSVDVRAWLLKNIQLSLGFYADNWDTGYYYGGGIYAMLFGGYRIPLNRWSFFADIGVGYGIDQSVNQYQINNPVFGARVGFDFLIINSIAAGAHTQFNVLYDDPVSLIDIGLGVSVSFVFRK